jgi:putative SOS response-associated peptidase YedK
MANPEHVAVVMRGTVAINERCRLTDAQSLLLPYPAELLTMYEVSAKVNSPAYNEAEAIRAVS